MTAHEGVALVLRCAVLNTQAAAAAAALQRAGAEEGVKWWDDVHPASSEAEWRSEEGDSKQDWELPW